ncbi:SusC/RagA family TonB-linked outer membrane protein [Sunxiuqinia elliptica]|uniref:TonB-linked SusC/RagA family outer membrane protein n=1 Tax=Sunxiuqinia elliptica TaxID=655355 RepID=A0A4R6H1I4_9BACT|nr:TonB-dependent receptor [Sunxiuqinia elliptica]TDO01221.1 TonB-linked SusC/RagA family outer membrane protein [Sunxiuqinia elliptica]TDO57732.1 TonB-linked SusC/RagA family outer membrane protein [Sunxiuqinia elliptica]
MKRVLFFLCCSFFSLSLLAQDITVSGTVTAKEDGQPLPGVSVVIQGTTIGTITDFDGNYALGVPADGILEFSYIGMKSQTVVVDGKSVIDVVLAEDYTDLDEIVVVGYGVQKKSVVTAAISSVSSEELENSTPTRIEDVMKGRVSGVQITQSSGQPGSDSKVRIRGIGTINNSEPLYIVDGMAVGGGISYLNPTDIESVEVLKDAASAAVYGARAANGVILITTKKGKSGKASINYDFSYGWQNPWKKKSVLNAKEYMTIINEAELNDNNAPRYSQEQIAGAGAGTDWQDETFNYDAPVQSHQISITGGTDDVTYFVSFGYLNQEGIVGGNYGRSNYERYSIRSNTTYNVFEADRSFLNNIKVGVNAGYSRVLSSGIETNSEYGSVLGSALTFNPLVPVYAEDPDAVLAQHPTAVTDKNGKVFSIPPAGFQEIANPVAMLNAPTGGQDNEDKFVSTFWGEINLIEGLKFKSSYGIDLAFWGADGYEFEHFLATQGKDLTQSHVYSNMHRGFVWQLENTLTYNKIFKEKHSLTVLLGQSAQEYKVRHLYGDDYDLLESDPNKANIDYAIAPPTEGRVAGGTGGFSNETLASYFGRVDYNYDERYMFQATVRRDGSSSFGPNNKWAVFPSFSVGWNVTNEAFMENLPDWFNYLKLRASWGTNGNNRIGNFSYTSLMDGNQNYYFGAGDDMYMQYGSSPSKLANADVKWEESEQIDLGFDTRFFDSALSFGFDYFKKTTNGMLIDQPIPGYVGKGAPIANAGDMENSGLEFELGYRGSAGDFSYSISANATYLKNKLIDMGNDSGEAIYESAGASGVGSYVKGMNGEVFPYFYGYQTDGLIQNQAEADAYNSMYGENARPGDVRFVDLNGDESITDDDKTKIGKGMPDWTYGLTVGAEWKQFDFNMFWQGSLGNDIFDFSQRGDIPAMNRPSWILDRWTGEGTSNSIPRMTNQNSNRNWRSSDLYIKDGSYARLKNIQLGYSLPSSLLQKAAISRLRVFVSAENLVTITDYDGFDPEIASGGYTTIGIDRGIYPQSRTIIIGANITF